jgi:hypothetical protein
MQHKYSIFKCYENMLPKIQNPDKTDKTIRTVKYFSRKNNKIKC